MKFKKNERDIWITSDPHYSHKNLIKSLSSWESGAHRDFNSVSHHNDTLVNNINDNVKKKDVLFILGDVAFGGYENVRLFMDRIICDEVHLVLGNHDKHIKVNRDGLKSLFTTVSTRLEVEIDEDMFVMDHYPIREWEGCHKGWYMLYGHTHPQPNDRFLNGYRSMNVGFDGHPEFRPYHISEIIKLLKNKRFQLHH